MQNLGFYDFSLRQEEDGVVKGNGVLERPKNLHRKITYTVVGIEGSWQFDIIYHYWTTKIYRTGIQNGHTSCAGWAEC